MTYLAKEVKIGNIATIIISTNILPLRLLIFFPLRLLIFFIILPPDFPVIFLLDLI